MPDMNERFCIADFKRDGWHTQVYVLKPGDHFDRFGGSSSGLVAQKTPSLIVRQTSAMGTVDTEYDVHNIDMWRRIFTAHANPKNVHTTTTK